MKMNKMYKGILLAVLGLASVPMAHAAYPTGDLLVGFTTGTGTDLIYDLGSESSIMATAAGNGGGVNGGGVNTWNLAAALGTAGYGSGSGLATTLGTISWGVVGAQSGSPVNIFATAQSGNTPSQVTGYTQGNKIYNAVGAIYSDLGTPANGDLNSWYSQTINTSINTQFGRVWDNPNSTGITSADFYSVLADNATTTFMGNFSLSSSGVLTLDAVPEPSTYALALLGGIGMLVLSSRKNLRKQA